MTFKVMKDGVGLLFCHIKNVTVARGLTWKQAHDLVSSQNSYDSNWNYWMTND